MSMKRNRKMQYAIKNGNIVSIAEVAPGLKCGCICPACGSALVAKKGSYMIHHFSHRTGEECVHGYETSLHLMAKDILSKAKRIMLPRLRMKIPRHDFSAMEAWETIEVIGAREVIIDHVELEAFSNGFVPDVIVYFENQKVNIEIRVTHEIDARKMEKIREAKESTIEVDLSEWRGNISCDDLEELLIGNNQWKKWAYNSFSCTYVEGLLQYINDCTEERRVITDSLSPLREKLCCIKLRLDIETDVHIWRCQNCRYCWGYNSQTNTVRCAGRDRISSIKEFKERFDAEHNVPE